MVGFCARSGAILSAIASSVKESEQSLAWKLMEQAAPFIVWIGDRNFGVWSILSQARKHQQDVLVRLSQKRARKLWAGAPLHSGEDRLVSWRPSRRDQAAPGVERKAIQGRLIYVRLLKAGKQIDLWLFTTLEEAREYPLELLVEWYAQRWQAELNFRSLKTQMNMAELDVATPEMAQKEFYAGLLAYSLVRALMWEAGHRLTGGIDLLSFNQTRGVLLAHLAHWMRGLRALATDQWTRKLVEEVARQTLPKRRKPRPTEIRRVRHRRQKFPPFKGSRSAARSHAFATESL